MEAKSGDTVKVDYQGRLKDGTVFDDSVARGQPLVFTLGQCNLIPGFEKAVEGMKPGEQKKIEIPAPEGYGVHHPELVVTVDRKEFPPDVKPVIGQQLQVSQDEDHYAVVSVTAVTDDKVTLDANHPLAGKDLLFDIKLIEITPGCSCGGHGEHCH
ncbi:MAG: FKBP-type peptidyl-prolyl cis-trans isomerase [Deltaproteobacteria bacterium]